jgi:YVTN family beta-propeller protein
MPRIVLAQALSSWLIASAIVWLPDAAAAEAEAPDRSPVDLALTSDGRWLVTANQTSNSVSLVDVERSRVTCEVPCGERPAAVAIGADDRMVLATAAFSGELWRFERVGEGLRPAGHVRLGFDPRGVAIAPDGRLAYVALAAGSSVAVVDLDAMQLREKITVGPWPRFLALNADGTRLAVGSAGDRQVAVIDTATRRVLFEESFGGLNPGQMQVSRDGTYAYLPWMVYRQNPITPANIRKGWVLGSRIGRIRLDGPARREAITLDPRGVAVSDPCGLALSPDESWVVASASGTHELLVYRLADLVFESVGGPGDHIDPKLLNDPARFFRVPLGGRPMAVCFAPDGRRVFVANYLANAVQMVDLEQRRVTQTIDLGGPAQVSAARRGEALFYDGQRSLDQWYSCHSCHYEGGANAVAMDTHNDGSEQTFKTVPALAGVTHTGPWTWHGWQTDLADAIRKSMVDTMQGPPPSERETSDMLVFLDQMPTAPSPHRQPDGRLTLAAERGRKIFLSEEMGCATCHAGTYFTDGKVHDVGLGSPQDAYAGYNTPSLLGVHARVRLLHDGRARSLEAVVSGPHAPEKVAGRRSLSAEELADLVAYLKSL